MMHWEARLKLLVRQIKQDVPGFEVIPKDQSGTQKLLGVFLKIIGNRTYMTDFWSTFFPKVYSPAKYIFDEPVNATRSFRVLAHEYIHLLDTKRRKIWFRMSYILPQLMALTALGAFAAIWLGILWLFFLSGLLFLLPLPAYFRMKWEMRGYGMNFAVNIWRHGKLQEYTKEWVLEHFIGPSYYFMWPFKKGVLKRFEQWEQDIHNGDVMKIRGFPEVYRIVKLSDDKAIEMAKQFS